jgi:diaminohydroxyphosphoribosylaminopyrimidine deaminase/5-amino-6-(5-phosphoribosylamino)uracil reductase
MTQLTDLDAAFMRRAFELAIRGRGRVEPNPMVGCVLVRDGRVIAEGFHEAFGQPHAEAAALLACPDPAGAIAYVSLEPCCDFQGKKTPACASALIAAKIARVVAACEDPNPAVAGRGVAQLRGAGIDVQEGLLGDEARQLNAAFFKLSQFSRPYVTLKWAQTADGKIAGPGGRRLAISNPLSLRAIHKLRSRCDAILVGIGTVLCDDPLLTARVPDPPRVPMRIVLDSHLRIRFDCQLVKTAGKVPLLVCCTNRAVDENKSAVARLHTAGVEVIALPDDGHGRVSLEAVLDELGRRKMTHLFVEPGPRLAESFIQANLADRVWITRSPRLANASDAPDAPKIDYSPTASAALDGDHLTEYLNPHSRAFYCPAPSADILLTQ